ncbi:MAG TPA: hypothetical protein VJH87_09690, partial [Vicinamibacteria bacterium]|nr:hypothetical protein [Vicinamibacteria bacterium]
MTFRSNRNGPYEIFWQLADGSGVAELLVQSEFSLTPYSWSPDGVLAYGVDRRGIWIASLEKGEKTKLLGGDFTEGESTFSPDGRWLAYASNESGRFEIYLRTFPDLGRK